MACTLTQEQITSIKPLGFLHNKNTDCFNARVITVNGKISVEQMRTIADAAEKYGNGEVEFTTRLTVEVRGIHFNNVEAFRAHIAKAGLQTGGTGALVRPVVSCKGTPCQYGLYDTFALSEKVHERFYLGYRSVKLPHKFKIAVGGCPNNCVKPELNDIGVIGQKVPVFDKEACRGCKKCQIETICPMKAAKVEEGILVIDPSVCINCGRCVGKCPFGAISESITGYKVAIGGRWGKKIAIGKTLSKVFTSEEEVMEVMEKAVNLFKDQGYPGERFADTIDRIGFEEVEKQLL